MNKITNLFPDGRKKALTFSYDDGVTQDKRLVDIFNKYSLKATFNLNSGIQSEHSFWFEKEKTIKRMNKEDIGNLYEGHEIAVHGLTHPFLSNLPKEILLKEIFEDRKNLEEMFGYPVRGMAYPYGSYNENVIDTLKACSLEYSRTVNSHEKFILPDNPWKWNPTCHHANSKLNELSDEFIEKDFNCMSLFYVWGHSYEFDVNENWDYFESFCEKISYKNDIWYATNIEILDYINACKKLRYSINCNSVYNPTAFSLWVEIDGKIFEIKSGETKTLKL
jgi:peptidoglycan/xylan/chitin deacetylase (PgdA/CDA1 family)